MSEPPVIRRAIAVSRKRASNPTLHKLSDLLGRANIQLAVHTSGEEASAAVLVAPDDQQIDCVFVDGNPPAFRREDLQHLCETVPHMAPLVVASEPSATTVLDAFRAGAFDFVDVDTLSEAGLLQALDRAADESRLRRVRRSQVSELRELVEEFLRVLVRTERRSIDLEDQLRLARGETNSEGEEERQPTVLVVDDDDDVLDMMLELLTRNGIKVVTAETGEDAVEEVRQGVEWKEPVDLIVLDRHLPDIDGFEAIRRIRGLSPSPPPILMMTGDASGESAIGAADLGVVGYVLKPIGDINTLVKRIKEAASRAGSDRRERKYLSRIKDRHAEFLLRYRRLAAQLDVLK